MILSYKSPILQITPYGFMASYSLTYATAVYLLIEYRRLAKRYKKLHDITAYLADMLVENDVYLTEFDVIALTALGVKLKIPNEHHES